MRLEARAISEGRGEGEALVSLRPLSLLGGVDAATGRVVNAGSDIAGEALARRVLVFPHGRGSTVGSYVLYGLKAHGVAPAAIVCRRAETIVATGAIMAGIPMVDGLPPEAFRKGDRLTVDGTEGWVELHGVEGHHVVTSFLENGGEILLLRRSEKVGSFQGYWAGVSGYLEPGDEGAEGRALLEIAEETGIRSPRLVRAGEVVLARGEQNPGKLFAVHPFLWHVDDRRIALDWEHEEYRWIKPEELPRFRTVPGLGRALAAVLKPGGGPP